MDINNVTLMILGLCINLIKFELPNLVVLGNLRFDSGFFPKSDAVYLEFSMILQNTLYAIYIVMIKIQSVSNKVSPRLSEFHCKHTMVAKIIC